MVKRVSPPPDGYTIGAEVRRVKFGRPPRKGIMPVGIEQGLDYWRKWDWETAPHVVVSYNRWLNRTAGGCIYEHRNFGRRLLSFRATWEAMMYLGAQARKARRRVEDQLESEKWDAAVAMARFKQGGDYAGTGKDAQGPNHDV